jgi:hypothetical protein
MRSEAVLSLSLVVAFLAFFSPKPAQAQSSADRQSTYGNAGQVSAQQEAGEMVTAQIELVHGLDAKKIQPGQQFRAKLDGTIHLKNGPELPRGTVLEGVVAKDDLNVNANSKLALRFTQADLKDGKTLPVKATIVSITPNGDDLGPNGAPNSDGSDVWDSHTLQVDQISALSGVDLHSRISSANSGVFVTRTKDDVKLAPSSRMTVAIAAQRAS